MKNSRYSNLLPKIFTNFFIKLFSVFIIYTGLQTSFLAEAKPIFSHGAASQREEANLVDLLQQTLQNYIPAKIHPIFAKDLALTHIQQLLKNPSLPSQTRVGLKMIVETYGLTLENLQDRKSKDQDDRLALKCERLTNSDLGINDFLSTTITPLSRAFQEVSIYCKEIKSKASKPQLELLRNKTASIINLFQDPSLSSKVVEFSRQTQKIKDLAQSSDKGNPHGLNSDEYGTILNDGYTSSSSNNPM